MNRGDLQEADHGHSARRSLARHGDSGVRTDGCRNEELFTSEILPIDDREVFEVLEFTGTPQPNKNERNEDSGRL